LRPAASGLIVGGLPQGDRTHGEDDAESSFGRSPLCPMARNERQRNMRRQLGAIDR